MDSAFLYSVVLFLHIGGVIALFVALTIEGMALRGLRHATTGPDARNWLGLMRPLRWLGPAALVLILLAALYLAAQIGSEGGAWIVVGLLGFLVIAGLGGIVTRRRMMVVGPGLGRWQGVLGAEQLQLAHDRSLLTSYTTRVALALGIVGLMTLKPDAAWSVAILVVAAVLGLAAPLVLDRASAAQPRKGAAAQPQPGTPIGGGHAGAGR
jgi:hypothetical protein